MPKPTATLLLLAASLVAATAGADSLPRLESVVPPAFPPVAGLTRIQCGPATFLVTLAPDGTVTDTQVTQRSTECSRSMAEDFTLYLERAVRSLAFDPSSLGGESGSIWVRTQLTGEEWPRGLGGRITFSWSWELWDEDPKDEAKVEDGPYSSGAVRIAGANLGSSPSDRIPVRTDAEP